MNSNASCSQVAAATLAGFYRIVDVVDRLPPGPNGRRLHPKVPVRWALKGVRGVKLRFIAAGRQKLTCDEWLVQFCDAVARAQQGEPQPAPGRPVQKPRTNARRARTRRILAGFGLGAEP
jgi:hypothetical protein